jgi:hypothetical protein
MSRTVLVAVALVALIFGLGYPLRDWLLRREAVARPAPPPSAASVTGAVPEAAAHMTVTALQGSVERRDAVARNWQPVAVDAQLRERDALRTSEGASAVLTASDGLRLELSEKSEFQLSDLGSDTSKVLLESGRMAARVPGGHGKLHVEVRGNPTLVDSEQGSFAILRNLDGQVTVATTEGRAAVRSLDQRVEVNAGEQSIVPVNRPPSPPSRIPASLFLKVARSGPAILTRRETDLGGRTTPGALVRINGVPVSTDENGRFKTRVPLREGTNSLDVTAQDVLGRVQRQTLPAVVVDTEAPKLQGKLVW